MLLKFFILSLVSVLLFTACSSEQPASASIDEIVSAALREDAPFSKDVPLRKDGVEAGDNTTLSYLSAEAILTDNVSDIVPESQSLQMTDNRQHPLDSSLQESSTPSTEALASLETIDQYSLNAPFVKERGFYQQERLPQGADSFVAQLNLQNNDDLIGVLRVLKKMEYLVKQLTAVSDKVALIEALYPHDDIKVQQILKALQGSVDSRRNQLLSKPKVTVAAQLSPPPTPQKTVPLPPQLIFSMDKPHVLAVVKWRDKEWILNLDQPQIIHGKRFKLVRLSSTSANIIIDGEETTLYSNTGYRYGSH